MRLPPVIVADAGPLIGLAKIGRLSLLRELYGEILIPPAVHAELQAGSQRPGSGELLDALSQSWIKVANSVDISSAIYVELKQFLDAGEAEAIALALHHPIHLLLIDERLGRIVAQRKGARITGTGAILLAAKQLGYITGIQQELDALHQAGYRLSARLRKELAAMGGE